jgi:aspartyl-tRNA(Asn)/glutamyl-tRNA(Gln) amidotransferase subunit B
MIVNHDEDPEAIATREGLIQQNDEGALRAIAQKHIDANPNVVAEYKAGKEASLMFFVGQIMKETKGSANPGIVQKILKELLQ